MAALRGDRGSFLTEVYHQLGKLCAYFWTGVEFRQESMIRPSVA